MASCKCFCFHKAKSAPSGAHQRSYGFVPFFHPTKWASSWEAVEWNPKGIFLSKIKLYNYIGRLWLIPILKVGCQESIWSVRDLFSAPTSSRASFQVKNLNIHAFNLTKKHMNSIAQQMASTMIVNWVTEEKSFKGTPTTEHKAAPK